MLLYLHVSTNNTRYDNILELIVTFKNDKRLFKKRTLYSPIDSRIMVSAKVFSIKALELYSYAVSATESRRAEHATLSSREHAGATCYSLVKNVTVFHIDCFSSKLRFRR